MRYLSARYLHASGPRLWRALEQEKEMVITLRGKPVAIMAALEGRDVEEYLALFRRARAMLAVDELQRSAQIVGDDQITDAEVAEEIRAVRGRRGN